MTKEEARGVLGDVSAYLASRAILENEMLAGHTFTDICKAIKIVLEQQPRTNLAETSQIGAEELAELRDICREEHVLMIFYSNHLEITQFAADGSAVMGYASYNELIKKGAGLLDVVAYLKQTQIKDQLKKKSARERAAEAWLNQYEQQEGEREEEE